MLEDAEDEDEDVEKEDGPREKENLDESVGRKLLLLVSFVKLTLPSDVRRDGLSLSPPPPPVLAAAGCCWWVAIFDIN